MEKIKILIVNDQKPVRQSLGILLRLLDGFEVVAEAGDGFEAVRLASDGDVDVVLVDSSMPATDGLEIARRIKETCPGTGIVMFTPLGNENAKPAASMKGVDAFVEKGAKAETLAAVIRQVRWRKERQT